MATDRTTAARLDELEDTVRQLVQLAILDEDAEQGDGAELEPDDAPDVSERMTRDELDRIARDAGLDPTPYGTKAQLVAAIKGEE